EVGLKLIDVTIDVVVHLDGSPPVEPAIEGAGEKDVVVSGAVVLPRHIERIGCGSPSLHSADSEGINDAVGAGRVVIGFWRNGHALGTGHQIGRASCRERG